MNIEKLHTEKGKSYWDNSGAYQKEMDELYKKLVPDKGEANTVHGEMIRAVNRLFYDFCNNGNCNVINVNTKTETEYHTCNECRGSGEVEVEDTEGDVENETCPECGGIGETSEEIEVDVDIEINKYYQKMIDVLKENLINKKPLEKLIDFLIDKSKGYDRYEFNEEQYSIYNNLTDEVMYQILTTENKSREVTDL